GPRAGRLGIGRSSLWAQLEGRRAAAPCSCYRAASAGGWCCLVT
ncbi:unnamed protein product, partial [Amoebophrya sp. A120]